MSSTLAPLRAPAFRWLLAVRTINLLGSAAAPIALAFAVLDLTGSTTDQGAWVRKGYEADGSRVVSS